MRFTRMQVAQPLRNQVNETPTEYALVMLGKAGQIVSRTTEKIEQAVMYGDLMVDCRQAIAFDVFQLAPDRRYIPPTEYHLH